MAGSGVRINWGGFQEAVDRASNVINNTEGLMLNIGKAMAGHTLKRFKKSVSPEGEAWKPVKYPRRDEQGRPKKGRAKPLVDNEVLQDSISVSASDFDVHVGSNLPYARIHQLGGQAGRGLKVTIPARPYLGLNEEDIEEIKALVREHMEGSFG
jgi:phage virion morphogenesis protein